MEGKEGVYKIRDRLYMVQLPLQLGMINCIYLIKEKGEGKNRYILVDAGSKTDYDTLWKILQGVEISYIIITHAHFDHVGCVTLLKEALSKEMNTKDAPKVIMHEHENQYTKLGIQTLSHGSNFLTRLILGVTDFVTGGQKFDPFEADLSFPNNIPEENINDLFETYGVRLHHFEGHSKGLLLLEIHYVEDVDEGPEKKIIIHLASDMLFPKKFKSFKKDLDFPLFLQGKVCDTKDSLNILVLSLYTICDMKPDEMYFSHISPIPKPNVVGKKKKKKKKKKSKDKKKEEEEEEETENEVMVIPTEISFVSVEMIEEFLRIKKFPRSVEKKKKKKKKEKEEEEEEVEGEEVEDEGEEDEEEEEEDSEEEEKEGKEEEEPKEEEEEKEGKEGEKEEEEPKEEVVEEKEEKKDEEEKEEEEEVVEEKEEKKDEEEEEKEVEEVEKKDEEEKEEEGEG